MSVPKARDEYSELVATIQERGLPYPLVAINGRVQLAGSVAYYQVLPLVEDALGEALEAAA